MHGSQVTAVTATSCFPQIVNLNQNAGLLSVINTIQAQRQTSAPHLAFCDQYPIDIKDRSFYTLSTKKEVLIKKQIQIFIRIAIQYILLM